MSSSWWFWDHGTKHPDSRSQDKLEINTTKSSNISDFFSNLLIMLSQINSLVLIFRSSCDKKASIRQISIGINELHISSKCDAINSISIKMSQHIHLLNCMWSLTFSIAGALACEFETKSFGSLFQNSLQIDKKVERLPDLTEKTSSRPCETDQDEQHRFRGAIRITETSCALSGSLSQRVGESMQCPTLPDERETVRSNGDCPFESFKRESNCDWSPWRNQSSSRLRLVIPLKSEPNLNRSLVPCGIYLPFCLSGVRLNAGRKEWFWSFLDFMESLDARPVEFAWYSVGRKLSLIRSPPHPRVTTADHRKTAGR
jgi:hypothetical protein